MYSHPFIVGMSSKALLKMVTDAVQSSLPIVFHMDCTFKCNDNEFPLLVLGITDAHQQFHPLSIRIISHWNYATYCEVLDHFNGLLVGLRTGIDFGPVPVHRSVTPLRTGPDWRTGSPQGERGCLQCPVYVNCTDYVPKPVLYEYQLNLVV